jgi:hypothetical protein
MRQVVPREQYVEMLVDTSLQEAEDLEMGFAAWCDRHVPTWHKMGRDETWIRRRIQSAQSTRKLHETMTERGYTYEQRRQVLREMYEDASELYDLALERERQQPEPGFILTNGNTHDLVQRYTLRVMLYEADKLAFARHCIWADLPPETPFHEDDHLRVVRDLSTVEELELGLALARHLIRCYESPVKLTSEQMAQGAEDYGRKLRAEFIAKYGYTPEESSTPYIPITVDGPQDHREYYAREYPRKADDDDLDE